MLVKPQAAYILLTYVTFSFLGSVRSVAICLQEAALVEGESGTQMWMRFCEMVAVQLALYKTYLLSNVCIQKATAKDSGNLGLAIHWSILMNR